MKKVKTLQLLSLMSTLMIVFVYNQCGLPVDEVKTSLGKNSDSLGVDVVVEQLDELNSVELFEQTVYPITSNHCVNCHQTQPPRHASSNVKTAHDAVVEQFKVNFSNIPQSRLVQKIRSENHGCWGNCQQNAQQMQLAIEQWYQGILEAQQQQQENNAHSSSEENFSIINPGSLPGITLEQKSLDQLGEEALLLRFGLESILGGQNVYLEMIVEEFDEYSYLVHTPRIIGHYASVQVKNLKFLLNGVYNPQNSTFTYLDINLPVHENNLSNSAMVVLKDRGPSEDQVSLNFEILRYSSTTNPLALVGNPVSRFAFQQTVYPLTRQHCINCHQTQGPRHAHNTVALAHDELLQFYMVDFLQVEKSRLVERLAVDAHHCWSNCQQNAQSMKQAIELWFQQAQ